MNGPSDGIEPSAKVSGLFATTHWSVVLTAGRARSPQSAEALEDLCRTYWYPLYAYVRRRGYSVEDAQDLTQAFFAHLLSRDFLGGVGPEKGRFRSFLLACLKHYLADEWGKPALPNEGVWALNAGWTWSRRRIDINSRRVSRPALKTCTNGAGPSTSWTEHRVGCVRTPQLQAATRCAMSFKAACWASARRRLTPSWGCAWG